MTAGDQKHTHRKSEWLKAALGLKGAEETPFPWQQRLLGELISGAIPRVLDLPTGLGKTSVMAIWLVARACGAPVPRRLVYVVDRRAVVDQATGVADSLRALVEADPALGSALGLEGRALPISTLRGQFVDNRRWMDDPTSPAIIVGTVDMVGSRLLFEGYGTSPKMRPYQAGLLGQDTLVLLDEAHLTPPFEALLRSVEGDASLGPAQPMPSFQLPGFKMMSLSATSRAANTGVFALDDEDRSHPEVRRRLRAKKALVLKPLPPETKLAESLAQEAWALSGQGTLPVRCLVFSHRREVAETALTALRGMAKKAALQTLRAELFVGGRRVMERQLAAKTLADFGFLAGTAQVGEGPAFVFATSAAEVGVDLDADHMVCDLVTWERMVQRLGRVNRRGRGDAQVVVIVDPKSVEEVEETIGKEGVLSAPYAELPGLGEAKDASPEAIVKLNAASKSNEALAGMLAAATTPAPLHPALSRPLVDAWSLTSLKEHTGRPEVAPWLRGWVTDEVQTQVIWRRYLPAQSQQQPADGDLQAFLEAAPPHLSEQLEAPTYRVLEWLEERATALGAAGKEGLANDGPGDAPAPTQIVALVLDGSKESVRRLSLSQLNFSGPDKRQAKREREDLFRELSGMTLMVDARLAGIRNGLLADDEGEVPPTADSDLSNELQLLFPTGFGVQLATEPRVPATAPWHQRFALPWTFSADGEAVQWLVVQKRETQSTNEEDRSSGPPQSLEEHQSWAEQQAQGIAQRLGLSPDYGRMLAVAARLHDEGKRAASWQQAFRAPTDGRVYAKTEGPIDFKRLAGYRHELGSLPYAEKDQQLAQLPAELQELALHLIAAHHGFARPIIGTSGYEEAPPSRLQRDAQRIALRFMSLQRRWGPWGLAWWESLLRAADQQASRRNEEREAR